MANFPNSVTVYTTRNPGDAIPSADWNSFGSEINAIEDGLINGTAPIHTSNTILNALSVSSGSTLNTLSVTGGSTFAGNVVITGGLQSSNSTVNNLTVNGTLTFSANRIVCTLTNSAPQNVNSGGAVGLNFDTEITDPAGMHSTSVNSSRINFVVAGSYLIGATINWSAGSTAGSQRFLGIKVNDATLLPGIQASPINSNAVAHGQSMSVIYTPASTTEYATVIVQQDSGSTMSISSGTAAGGGGLRVSAALIGI